MGVPGLLFLERVTGCEPEMVLVGSFFQEKEARIKNRRNSVTPMQVTLNGHE